MQFMTSTLLQAMDLHFWLMLTGSGGASCKLRWRHKSRTLYKLHGSFCICTYMYRKHNNHFGVSLDRNLVCCICKRLVKFICSFALKSCNSGLQEKQERRIVMACCKERAIPQSLPRISASLAETLEGSIALSAAA